MAGSVVPATPVSILLPTVAASAPDAGLPAMAPTTCTNGVTEVNPWPNLQVSKSNPGFDDWRALERRAFSLRLRGPFGEIDG